MQTACKDTKTLPRDLWDKFKKADYDGSGRLEVIFLRPSRRPSLFHFLSPHTPFCVLCLLIEPHVLTYYVLRSLKSIVK